MTKEEIFIDVGGQILKGVEAEEFKRKKREKKQLELLRKERMK